MIRALRARRAVEPTQDAVTPVPVRVLQSCSSLLGEKRRVRLPKDERESRIQVASFMLMGFTPIAAFMPYSFYAGISTGTELGSWLAAAVMLVATGSGAGTVLLLKSEIDSFHAFELTPELSALVERARAVLTSTRELVARGLDPEIGVTAEAIASNIGAHAESFGQRLLSIDDRHRAQLHGELLLAVVGELEMLERLHEAAAGQLTALAVTPLTSSQDPTLVGSVERAELVAQASRELTAQRSSSR